MTPKLTYTTAISELEKILAELENSEDINMEHISELVKRAAELMTFCKQTLHKLDDELEKAIEGIEL
ncbi:MAG: exodeoxyribonuclease VII small subunit [Paludibacter sp.]|jgi:exodeoxyribonuclease VII small subunit|nr:exodeoxyribonuclease VII small subunit [Paludibacter sp.]